MHTRRLVTKTATAILPTLLYPPAPADTRDGVALARGAVLWVHARTQKLKTKNNLAGKYYKEAVFNWGL